MNFFFLSSILLQNPLQNLVIYGFLARMSIRELF